jgi:hypothetical protein
VIFKSYAQDSNAFTGTTSNHNLTIGTNNTQAITIVLVKSYKYKAILELVVLTRLVLIKL